MIKYFLVWTFHSNKKTWLSGQVVTFNSCRDPHQSMVVPGMEYCPLALGKVLSACWAMPI